MMSMDYYNLAIKRKSTRDFKKKTVGDDLLAQLNEHFEGCHRLMPDIEVDLRLLEKDAASKLKGSAGYHNFLIEAPYYLLLLSSVEEHYMENAGYIGEELVLKLTEMGLASCWVTIMDEPMLKKSLSLDTGKVAVALIAFGYEAGGGLLSRLDIKSPSDVLIKKRKGFVAPKLSIDSAIYEGEWGKVEHISDMDVESELTQACIAACCAPSFLNIQPYRFIHDKDKMLLVSLESDVTDFKDFRLNIGIVMLHFAAVMSRQNTMIKGWVLEVPDKDYKLPEGAVIEGYCCI